MADLPDRLLLGTAQCFSIIHANGTVYFMWMLHLTKELKFGNFTLITLKINSYRKYDSHNCAQHTHISEIQSL